jgi:hypothetical protein
MIVRPTTLITEESFKRWKNSFKLKVHSNDDENVWCYVIPLISVGNHQQLGYVPAIVSSSSNEYEDTNGNTVYTMRLFDAELPAIVSEQEVEIIYSILTGKSLV